MFNVYGSTNGQTSIGPYWIFSLEHELEHGAADIDNKVSVIFRLVPLRALHIITLV